VGWRDVSVSLFKLELIEEGATAHPFSQLLLGVLGLTAAPATVLPLLGHRQLSACCLFCMDGCRRYGFVV